MSIRATTRACLLPCLATPRHRWAVVERGLACARGEERKRSSFWPSETRHNLLTTGPVLCSIASGRLSAWRTTKRPPCHMDRLVGLWDAGAAAMRPAHAGAPDLSLGR